MRFRGGVTGRLGIGWRLDAKPLHERSDRDAAEVRQLDQTAKAVRIGKFNLVDERQEFAVLNLRQCFSVAFRF